MNDLTIDDFKVLLLDVYLLQREVATLRAQIASETEPEEPDTEA